jgi:hypothetical protein
MASIGGYMAEDGLMEGWVGKVVQVLTHEDPDPHIGMLEGWDDQGVVLRFAELDARLSGPLDEEPTPPMLVHFPWAAIPGSAWRWRTWSLPEAPRPGPGICNPYPTLRTSLASSPFLPRASS